MFAVRIVFKTQISTISQVIGARKGDDLGRWKYMTWGVGMYFQIGGAEICVNIPTFGGLRHRWRNRGGGEPLAPQLFFQGGPNLRIYFYNIASA